MQVFTVLWFFFQVKAFFNEDKYKEHFYMIYCGNKYGKDGLGIAKLTIVDE